MGHSRTYEYWGGLYLDGDDKEHVVGVNSLKQAKQWVDSPNNAAVYGQKDVVKVVLWPQTARARRFLAGRGDFIEVTKEGTRFVEVG